MCKNQKNQKNPKNNSLLKLLLCTAILFLICIIPRTNYPLTSNWEVSDIDIFKDDNDKFYLYQADPYYYLDKALIDPTDNFLSRIMHETYPYIEYLPVAFMIITTLLLLFIILELTGNITISFIFSALYSLHPHILVNSYVGFVDTNTLNFLFTVLIIHIIMMIIKFKNYIIKIIYILLLIYMLIMFYLTWSGWSYILFIAILSLFVYMLRNIKWYYSLITTIFFVIFTLYENSIKIFFRLLEYNTHISECQTNYYDNWFILPGLLLGLYLLYKIKDNYKDYINILLYNLYFITFAAGIFALRFRAYFYIPFFILLAVSINDIKITKYRNILIGIIATVLVISCVIHIRTANFTPMMDDSIKDMCDYVNNNMDNSSVIIGRWDYGHIHNTYCDNPVFYKGSYDEKERYENAIIATDENVSLTIFNKLNNDHLIILNSKSITNGFSTGSFIVRGIYAPETLLYYDQVKCFENEWQKICILSKKR